MELIDEEFMGKINDLIVRPNVSTDLAIELVKRLYGLQVTEIKSLDSFYDQNFHIKVSFDHHNPHIAELCEDGYTLKVMNTMKSNLEGHFDAIHEAMIRLHEKGLRVPQPTKNLEGRTWKLETLPLQKTEGEVDKTLKCGIHLLTYIPGAPLDTIEANENILFQWGKLLAKFHIALEDLDCPSLKEQPTFLDAKKFRFINAFLDSLPEGSLHPDAKPLLQNVLKRFLSEYENISELPKGFLHGDFNERNILVQTTSGETDSYLVDGILDFDEMHYGSYAWDLGILLGHALLVKKNLDPLEAVGHAVAGYQSVRRLSEAELRFLKISMECRVGMMTLVSTIVDKDPSNSYIAMLAPLQPKLDILKLLSEVDNKSLLKIYDYHTNLVQL